MATYAIGDIQGCFSSLEKLLALIQFDPVKDTLWLTGDLVNRGTQSLETLRFIKALGNKHRIVLGNHDLHLLAVAHHAHSGWEDDTLQAILTAPDSDELIQWLLQQPLIQCDAEKKFAMVHAGLAFNWDLEKAIALSREVEVVLQSDQRVEFFHHMYGNHPKIWSEDLQGWDRLRCITNYFTRMRFCHVDGSLELKTKDKSADEKTDLVPWFQVPNRATVDLKIIFGHWAALAGETKTPNTFAIDTGCVWGYSLTAMRLEDERRFSVGCGKS